MDLARELLLSRPEMAGEKDFNGWTPLHEACVAGSADCVEALLEAKAMTLDLVAAGGEGGLTPLHEASEGGWAEAVKALLEGVARNGHKFGGITPR